MDLDYSTTRKNREQNFLLRKSIWRHFQSVARFNLLNECCNATQCVSKFSRDDRLATDTCQTNRKKCDSRDRRFSCEKSEISSQTFRYAARIIFIFSMFSRVDWKSRLVKEVPIGKFRAHSKVICHKFTSKVTNILESDRFKWLGEPSGAVKIHSVIRFSFLFIASNYYLNSAVIIPKIKERKSCATPSDDFFRPLSRLHQPEVFWEVHRMGWDDDLYLHGLCDFPRRQREIRRRWSTSKEVLWNGNGDFR